MAKDRKPIPDELAARVQFEAHRTCCVCRQPDKSIQIHHINNNPSDNRIENLAVVCLQCHDDTQIKGGFGRKLDADQVRLYRDDWNSRVALQRQQFFASRADELGTEYTHQPFSVDPLFGTPYGYERGSGFLTLTVPVGPNGDNGSGSLYSQPGTELGVVLRILDTDLDVTAVGHLLGVEGSIATTIEIRDVSSGLSDRFVGEAIGVPGTPIYEGIWNWFDCPIEYRFCAGGLYEVRPLTWSMTSGRYLNENNWNFLMPFLRDHESRAYDRPFIVDGFVEVVDGTFHGSRITGIPPLSLTLGLAAASRQ